MKIDVVLVTYNPEIALLQKVLLSITAQVRYVFVIDNSPVVSNELMSLQSDKIKIEPLNDNKGIAYAQNVGIKMSKNMDADYVLLSDQDTIYPNNFVTDMLNVENPDFAAISPLFRDINQENKNEGFLKKSTFGFKKFYPSTGVHSIFQSIASGCIINTKHLDDIGMMDEALFIDWVDMEWCWRAIAKGHLLLGNANVTITHQLGDEAINVGFRNINLRSPIRHYYITRNAFYLALRCKDLGKKHQVILFLKSFRYLIAFPIISKPHFVHLKYVFKGFLDGLLGVLGKYKD